MFGTAARPDDIGAAAFEAFGTAASPDEIGAAISEASGGAANPNGVGAAAFEAFGTTQLHRLSGTWLQSLANGMSVLLFDAI